MLLLLACTTPSDSQKGDSAVDTSDSAVADTPFDVSGFDTPESVLYDADRDRYLVSEIVGSPTDHDGEGRITIVSPDGEVVGALVEGLDAPKGTGITSGELSVADIDRVRRFDVETGEAHTETVIDGAQFLNDITVHDLDVWVSDYMAASGPSVWQLDDDVEDFAIAQGEDVPRPNGLWWTADGIYALSGESVFTIHGDSVSEEEVGVGSLDGIVVTNAGDRLVSSWEAQAVLTDASGSWEVLVDGLSSPADIGYDSVRNRLLVPIFNEGIVRVIPLD